MFLIVVLLAATTPVLAGESWDFLPTEPVFSPLIGDPKEARDAIDAQLDHSHFDGCVGQTIEFLQWHPEKGADWGWGIEGSSHIQLDSLGNATFPERVSDWQLGTYFSMKSGDLSARFEYLHVSSHLGDALFYPPNPPHIIYSRESLRLILSWDLSETFRLYGGPAIWTHLSPNGADPRSFGHAGFELYTGHFPFIAGTLGRGYFSYDLQIYAESGVVVDQAFQAGLQWKWKKESHQSIRMAALVYTGNSQYGQFFQKPDGYLGLGIFFDP
jgi:hypothetical protein